MSKDKQVAPRQASDKKTDLKQYRADLDRLFEEMRNHAYSFATDNYRDYMIALGKEREFLVRAQRLGKAGIDAYRFWTRSAMNHHAEKTFTENVRVIKHACEERIARLRDQYMRPIDHYRERLASHDWTYAMSDSMSVHDAGERRQAILIQEALEGGEEYKQAFKEAYEKAWSHGNPGTVWSWEKYLMLKGAVRKPVGA